jgi:hypothetical protein
MLSINWGWLEEGNKTGMPINTAGPWAHPHPTGPPHHIGQWTSQCTGTLELLLPRLHCSVLLLRHITWTWSLGQSVWASHGFMFCPPSFLGRTHSHHNLQQQSPPAMVCLIAHHTRICVHHLQLWTIKLKLVVHSSFVCLCVRRISRCFLLCVCTSSNWGSLYSRSERYVARYSRTGPLDACATAQLTVGRIQSYRDRHAAH